MYYQWNLPVQTFNPCYKANGEKGHCATLKSCYPFYNIPANMPAWAFGEEDTCKTYDASGTRSVYGVCCASRQFAQFPGQVPGQFPGAGFFPGVGGGFPLPQHPGVGGGPGAGVGGTVQPFIPPLPTHERPQTHPPLPTYPPGHPAAIGQQPGQRPQHPVTQPPQTPPPPPQPPVTQRPTTQPPAQQPQPTPPPQAPASPPGGQVQCGIGGSPTVQYNEKGEDVEARQRIDGEHPLRVRNGWPANKGEWPWISALLNRGRQFCGGSLIDDRHILTAAHCVAHMSRDDVAALTVRLGDYQIRTVGETKTYESKVARVVRHKGFSSNTLHHDVALLTLENPVPASYNATIRPVCLPDGNDQYVGRMATVVGWGSLYEKGPQPDTLQELTMEVWPNEKCSTTYGKVAPAGITNHMLCAGKKGKDSCSGDSGGPLHVPSGNTWFQVGVVSWGIGCGKEHYPGVYTRTTEVRPWIERVRRRF